MIFKSAINTRLSCGSWCERLFNEADKHVLLHCRLVLLPFPLLSPVYSRGGTKNKAQVIMFTYLSIAFRVMFHGSVDCRLEHIPPKMQLKTSQGCDPRVIHSGDKQGVGKGFFLFCTCNELVSCLIYRRSDLTGERWRALWSQGINVKLMQLKWSRVTFCALCELFLSCFLFPIIPGYIHIILEVERYKCVCQWVGGWVAKLSYTSPNILFVKCEQ